MGEVKLKRWDGVAEGFERVPLFLRVWVIASWEINSFLLILMPMAAA